MNPWMDYRWSDALRMASLALLYALLTKVVTGFFMFGDMVLVVWPPSWLTLAILLIAGRKFWPATFAGAFVASAMMGKPIPVAICIAIGDTVGVLIGVAFLDRIERFNRMLTSLSDYFWLGIAAVLSGCVDALISSGALFASGLLTQQDLFHDLLLWAERNSLGIILATPIILAWQIAPKGWFSRRQRIAETVACFGLAFLTGQIVFLGLFQEHLGNYAQAFLIFVFIVWSAVRFGRHGVFLVIVFTGVQALLGAIHGTGFFAKDIARTGLANLWFYMIVLTDVGLGVDFVMYELRRSEQRERTRNQVLELLAKSTPLVEVLQTIVNSVEKENADMLCCILLMDKTGKHLFTGAVSSIPDCNCAAIHHVDIDLAASPPLDDKSTVPAMDIEMHPHLQRHKEIADKTSLHSRWVEPIKGPAGDILGAVAMYRPTNVPRTDDDIRLIGQVANLAGIAIDQSRVNEELQLALMVYQNSSEAMMITDADTIIMTVNPAFTELTGYTPDEVIGKKPRILSSGHQDGAFYQAMWASINTQGRWQGEIRNRRKNGQIYIEWLTINTILNDDDSVHRRVALFSDITQKRESEALIWKQANFDFLTGLPNRSMLLDRLQLGLKKAHRTGLPLAVMFLDLDRFKEVNDTLGHGMGDVLLKESSRRLTNCIRESDTLARWGGDEFIIILESVDGLGNIEQVAQKILHQLSQPFTLGTEEVYISVSIGITFCPNDAVDIDGLLKNADQAMYAAKHQGRNGYSYFTPSMQQAAQARMRLISDLHGALAGKQFQVYYQPIVELGTGIIDKAEALIRWHHPRQGLVSPAEFIPIAEETGLINGIGDWVFCEATRQVAIWQASLSPSFQISINKSPVQLQNENSDHAAWEAQLLSLGLPGKCVVIEITEGLLLDNDTATINKLLDLRNSGIEISLDDFGTGYSSLSYLQKFNINYLKIDQSFVHHLSSGSNNLVLCEAIIAMAHRLGIRVIAEGIETEEQRDLLTAAGCDYGQGFLFSKPVPAEVFEKFLQPGI